jgi:hypothetical protein
VAQQTCPGRATQGHANPALRVCQPLRALRPRGQKAGKPLDEGPSRTGGIAAVQAPGRHLQAHLAAEAWQISGTAHAAAVDGGTPLPAIRAAPAPRSDLGADEEDAGIRPGHLNDPAPR